MFTLALQKWSDHAPVILELSGITTYDDGPPPPCYNSSRAVPKHGLQALFQRKAAESQKVSDASGMRRISLAKGAKDMSEQPCEPEDTTTEVATDKAASQPPGCTQAGKGCEQRPGQNSCPRSAAVGGKRKVGHRVKQDAATKQRKVTGFFHKKC